MITGEDLAAVIGTYVRVPETPARASMNDWRIARALLQSGAPVGHILHAIRIATLRRHLRDPDQAPLEPVHSLAYYRATLEGLEAIAFDPEYIEYVEAHFDKLTQQLREEPDPEAQLQDQNAAVSGDR